MSYVNWQVTQFSFMSIFTLSVLKTKGINAKSTPEVFSWGHSVYGSIFRGKNTLKVTKTGQFCISVKSTNSPWFVWPIMLHHMLTWHPFYFKSEFLVEKIKIKKKISFIPSKYSTFKELAYGCAGIVADGEGKGRVNCSSSRGWKFLVQSSPRN